ncbi:MAG: SGNH/GDSL hydrolase family protein, partial [Xanthobacteraceae bacterium]
MAFGILILEVLYRGYLRVEYPARFANPPADQLFTTWDTPMWRYSDRFGYDYVPAQDVTQAVVQNSHVVLCETEKYVNEQGNIGPGVSDYGRATYKILVFGDSFSASALNGQTWPSILQAKLEEVTKRRVRVLNLARDGYGVLQMFDLAAAKVPELKPDLVIFAFNASALSRARSWRVLVGRGDDVRFVTTTQNSEIPPLDLSTDFALIAPAATRKWCANMLHQSPQAQERDPVLINILRKRRYIEGENGPMAIASVYGVRSSYVYDRLI